MARPRPLAARLSAESGFGLIEVMVSALVVVIVSLAVLGSMNAAGKASGAGKAKAVAANLAQQDQERMQGMRPVDLMSLVQTKSVDMAADGKTVAYTVKSEGAYVLNPASGSGCTNGQRDEYLRIVSTVSWPSMRTRPVRVESMIAPPLDAVAPNQGSAVLRITRANGTTPVTGQSVDLVGPQSGRQSTGEEGCAFFANYPVGSYSFRFSNAGWVDPNGDQEVSLPTGVTNQDIASLDTLYDQAGKVQDVSVMTVIGGSIIGAKADKLVMSHPGVQRNGGQREDPTADGSGRFTIEGLFPFASPYTIYSGGQCGRALPPAMTDVVNASGGVATLVVQPGTTYANRIVLEPALNPTVRYPSGGAVRPGARVYVKSTNPSCPTPDRQDTDANGQLPERGFPYGDYTVCAEYTDGGLRRNSGWQAKTNNEISGVNWDLNIPAGGGDQPCTP